MTNKSVAWQERVQKITTITTGAVGALNERTWGGEDGPLPCLSNPDEAILHECGYKRLAKLFCDPRCFECQQYGSGGNPVTLRRYCDDCSWKKMIEGKSPEYRLVCEENAKDAFLLSDKDLKGLPKVSLTPMFENPATASPSNFYMHKDIKRISFQNFGGADGLAEEIKRRESVFGGRLSGQRDKALDPRPADNLDLLEQDPCHLPLGLFWCENGELVYGHSQDCSVCNRCVSPRGNGLVGHGLFKHGQFYSKFGFDSKIENNLVNAPVGEPERVGYSSGGLPDSRRLGFPDELVSILSGAEIQRSSKKEDVCGKMLYSLRTWTFSFPGKECKIMLVHETARLHDYMRRGSYRGNYLSCMKYENDTIRLLFQSFDGDDGIENISNESVVKATIASLGLESTNPVHFTAALLSKMFAVDEINHRQYSFEIGHLFLPPPFAEPISFENIVPIARDAVEHIRSFPAGGSLVRWVRRGS
ncbi:MAG: hypothetical protein SGILL_005553 [Bacillariaceae sp.]